MAEEEPLDIDHGQVPADLLELYEVLEYDRLVKEEKKRKGGKVQRPLTATTGRVVTRQEWGARPPKSLSTNINPAAGGIAWHYEGPRMGPFPHSSCATKVRGIQSFHMDSRGWADIAYTTIYCPHGYIFVGRWWGKRTAAQGTNDGNARYYAACFLGGVGDPFTEEARIAALEFRSMATADGRAGPDNKPHSHFHATGCPGDSIRYWLSIGMPSPVLPSPTQPQGEEVSHLATSIAEGQGVFLYNGQTKFVLGTWNELVTFVDNNIDSNPTLKKADGNFNVKVYDDAFFSRVPNINELSADADVASRLQVTFDDQVKQVAKEAVKELSAALNAGLNRQA